METLPPLYLIADQATCGERPMLEVLARALDGGVRLVQLREKMLDDSDLMDVAGDVLTLTQNYDAMLMINSAVNVATKVGAQGVHLPRDGSPEAIRKQFESPFLIGYSAHSHAELDRAGRADFVTYSPVFAPGSKPGYDGDKVGVDGLQEAVSHTQLPVYALGGITPARAVMCRDAGCAGVAVMSGILAAQDPEKVTRQFIHVWES